MATIPPANIKAEDYSEHTEHLFCGDMTCPCHESKYLIEELAEFVDEGLASNDDANRIYYGKVV